MYKRDRKKNIYSVLVNRTNRTIRQMGLVLLLVIVFSPLVQAQLPFFPTNSPSPSATDSQWWDPNKAYRCGRLWCSDVHLIGSLSDHFTVAIAPNPSKDQAALTPEAKVEQRAKLVQQTYEAIIKKIIQSDVYLELIQRPDIAAIANQTLSQKKDTFSLKPKKPFPLTPNVEVGIENGQTVIYAVGNIDLGIATQTLVTVNEDDSLYNGQPIPQIAEKWRDIIREGFSETLWGKTLDRLYPLKRIKYALLIAVFFACLILILAFVSYLLKKLEKSLLKEQRQLKQNLTDRQPPQPTEEPQADTQPLPPRSQWTRFWSHLRAKSLFFVPHGEILNQLGNLVETLPNNVLKRQLWLGQFRNLLRLLLQLLFWGKIWLLLSSLALTVLLFPNIRRYSFFFWGQATTLPLLWMSITLVDKIFDLLIDYWLHRWANQAQQDDPTSNRYNLRVSTYSSAFKGATTVIFIAIGVYFTLLLYVKDPTVLAGAGGLAVIAAFLTRNLFEDMLNGALILWTDRYAIGDVIAIDRFSGLVENMTLYITQIRGTEGRLITIPNGKISIVENLTKDWSRVDFTVTISAENDISQAFQLIEQVAEVFQSEPNWQDKILEPAAILGVDELSHEGMVIKVWIKTLPNQQFAVGREFRRRIKQAFDLAGISLGVPQRAIRYFPDEH